MSGIGLYVHFPWCVKKCPYCDFNSHPVREALPVDDYLTALIADLKRQLEGLVEPHFATVFFGGGTPSLFPPVAFERLLRALEGHLDPEAEITLEANPGTTEHGDLTGYRSAGINRVSFGVQSFNDSHLVALGRIHDRQAVFRSYDLARKAGFDNVNLDLMYGLPQQTRAQAIADLDAAIDLGPEHVSWYQLTLEPKTEFARRPPPLPGDIVLSTMEDAGYDRLAEAGYERYEVSAYARGGRRSRHNLGYWTFGDYLGVGAGAHGKLSESGRGASPALSVRRTRKASQPRLYLQNPEATTAETLSPVDLPGEFMLNVLRLREGVPVDSFVSATGLPVSALEPIRGRQIERALLLPDRLAATARGYTLLDSLIQEYL